MYPVIVTGTEGNNTGRHVRCYCNLPSCVATGYMCKSPMGGCFSELLTDMTRASHGCIETLDNRNEKTKCMNSPSGSTVRNTAGLVGVGQTSTAFVLCCFKDLCNHVDSPISRHRLNDTLLANGNWSNVPNAPVSNTIGTPGTSESNSNEIWFRAATIAVPICGALILFVLIALAVKLLRSDALDAANKLSATYIPHGSGQGALETPLMKKVTAQRGNMIGTQPAASAPLLLSHSNIINICETPHIKNETTCNKSVEFSCDCKDECVIMQHHAQTGSQHSSPLSKPLNSKHNKRDVNVNIVSSTSIGDSDVCTNNSKLYEKQLLPLNDKLYNKETILYWGQTGATNMNHCPR